MHAEGYAVTSALARLFGTANGGEALPLSGIRERAMRELSQFSAIVREELASLDISIPPAISLVSCSDCQLTLESEHPQRDRILAWLDGNDRVAKYFKEVEVLFEVVRATENLGVTFAEDSCFHIGLTSAGPIAYFQDQQCTPQ